MAKARVWNSLSSAYRARLLRSGITQETYEAGASLKKARGHSQTPEHPSEAIKQPSKYQRYRLKAKSLQQQVFERKQRLWDSRFKYHDVRSRRYVFTGEADVKVPGVRKMIEILAKSDDEWEQLVYEQALSDNAGGLDDDWRFLFYH